MSGNPQDPLFPSLCDIASQDTTRASCSRSSSPHTVFLVKTVISIGCKSRHESKSLASGLSCVIHTHCKTVCVCVPRTLSRPEDTTQVIYYTIS